MALSAGYGRPLSAPTHPSEVDPAGVLARTTSCEPHLGIEAAQAVQRRRPATS